MLRKTSGAPIISKVTGKVMAINYTGYDWGCFGKRRKNYGKIISYVAEEIKAQAGEDVYNDITTLRRKEGPTVGNEFHGKTMSIQSHNGRYIRADDENRISTQTYVGSWEKFQFLFQNDGTYALKTVHGKYIRAISDGKLDQVSNLGPWEKFHLIKKGTNGYAFRTFHYDYIRSDGDKFDRQYYDGSYETFKLA